MYIEPFWVGFIVCILVEIGLLICTTIINKMINKFNNRNKGVKKNVHSSNTNHKS